MGLCLVKVLNKTDVSSFNCPLKKQLLFGANVKYTVVVFPNSVLIFPIWSVLDALFVPIRTHVSAAFQWEQDTLILYPFLIQ